MGKVSTSVILLAGLCFVAFMRSHTALFSAPVITISFGGGKEESASHVETGIVKRRLAGDPVDSFRVRPSIILFGDSTTENSFGNPGNNGVGFGSLVASAYSRRADVLNRGFSGYNTKWAVDRLVDSVFTGPVAASQQIVNPVVSENFLVKKDMPSTLFVTVMFGTSDMVDKGDEAHVSIKEYGQNLNTIVEHILNCMGNATPIVMMTPPPFSAKRFIKSGPNEEDSANIIILKPRPTEPSPDSAKQSDKKRVLRQSSVIASPVGSDGRAVALPPYSNNRARAYGFKVKQVAKEHNLALVDTWQLLEGTSGEDNFGPKYLYDGMHPNEEGNRMIYQGIMSALEKRYPEVLPMKDGMGRYGTKGIPLEGELWHRIDQQS